ncbi:SIMPL domain-containing protein [Pontibacter sp. CAU 1760]
MMNVKTLYRLLLMLCLAGLGSCRQYSDEQGHYLEVIGEAEQAMPEAGYKLNLFYNGPLPMRNQFRQWADSLQKQVPSMMLTSDNIFFNHMPGMEVNQPSSPDRMQSSMSFNILVTDSAMYSRILQDLVRRQLPFNLNVNGTYLEPKKRQELMQQLLQKSVDDAKTKLRYLAPKGADFEIVSITELDNTVPYGPEYNDFNRRMVSRVKVNARLKN